MIGLFGMVIGMMGVFFMLVFVMIVDLVQFVGDINVVLYIIVCGLVIVILFVLVIVLINICIK